MDKDNPFFDSGDFPPFSRLAPQDALDAIPKIAAETEREVARLEKDCTPTWEGRVAALTAIAEPLNHAWHLVHHMLSVRNGPEWREAHEKLLPTVVGLSLRMAQSKPLADALTAIRGGAGWDALPEGRRRVVEAGIRDARDSGVALEGAAKERFSEIAERLSSLSTKFSDNVLDATRAFAIDLKEEADFAGLPPAVRALCADAGKAAGVKGRATLEAAVYVPFMQYSERRDLREALWRARSKRASEGALDNSAIIAETLALRRETASLVGFPDYARLALDSRMAKTPENVRRTLRAVSAAAKPAARREMESLRRFAAERGHEGALKPWDVAYWARRQLEALYGYSPEQLRPYFQFPRVLEGLFALAEELFGVRAESADGEADVWHEDVRFFRLRDAATGEIMAHFYLDPYSRPEEKRGGAWMDSFHDRSVRPGGSVRLPLALLCCNQSRPAGGKPSLMTLDEVETLFHEFGHALQCMLTRIDDAECAGISNIEWDAVELASQFMENWCRNPETLRAISSHVETGERLPDDLVRKIVGAAKFGEGRATARQLSFALFDMDAHESVPSGRFPDAFAAWAGAREEFSTIPAEPEDACFPDSFTHVFAGGYAAGYY
ncbi:MAG: M3 family metallopeptidase, partial [Kiritimatiellae bacterium]|nr:M3 family metallopeptidase [Kiritimatiellia bacterium]